MRVLAAALLLSAPAAADVVNTTPAGFELTETNTVEATPERVWAALRAPQTWWDKEQTVSGDASGLYLDAQAGGCFCERLPDKGSVEHARVMQVAPGRLLRMTGALGPLAAEAVTGTLTVELKPAAAGATTVTITYVVGGYLRAGAEGLAPTVDRSLAHQLDLLKAAAEGPPPRDPADKS